MDTGELMSNLMTSDLIRTTRHHCQGNSRQPINTLANAKDDLSNDAVLSYPLTGISIGSTLEIGWVLYQVTDMNAGTKTVTILPEVVGSAVDHAAGERVTLRPRYPARRVIEELNNDLMDLTTQGIYKMRVVEPVAGEVEVPDDAVRILQFRDEDDRAYPSSQRRLSDLPAEPDTIEWHSGYIVFGCTFSEFSYTTDMDVSYTGLVNTVEDLPPLGAAIRLLAGMETQRNLFDTQGDTRRPDEVPPGSMSGSMRNLAAIRQGRINGEHARYLQRYGLKIHTAI